MAQNTPSAPASQRLVTAIVLFYLVAALAMVMANKWVLQTTEVPLFFIFTQMFMATVLFLVAHIMKFITLPAFDLQVCKGLVLLTTLNILGLSLSNFTLKYVDASFYQVARGMVLPFTVVLSTIMLRSRPSLQALVAIFAVTAGFFVGVFLDGAPTTPIGIICGVLSSGVTAIHSVVIKRSLDVVQGSAIHLSWYMNSLSAVFILPVVVLAGEVPAVFELFTKIDAVSDTGAHKLSTFLWGSFITGSLGFLMSIATLLSIKVTSPITHMISSAARGVFASMLGIWIFHDIMTIGRAVSITIILGGSIYYTWVKHLESQSGSSAAPPSKTNYERLPLEDIEAKEPKKDEV